MSDERLAELEAERTAIIERIDGLNDGESLLDAIGSMHDEWEHNSREMARAGYETIPNLTTERDAARAALADAERRERELWEVGENMAGLIRKDLSPDGNVPVFDEEWEAALDQWHALAAQTALAEPVKACARCYPVCEHWTEPVDGGA